MISPSARDVAVVREQRPVFPAVTKSTPMRVLRG
jgi:hypothetical protein